MKPAAVLIASLLLVACSPRPETAVMVVGGERFTVELAKTAQEQARGLMHRRTLDARAGMLFVYPTDRRLSFWMKNTRVPLSIAFLSRDGRIVQIEDMEPLSLEPVGSVRSVRYALEVPQGTFRRLGLDVGDLIGLPETLR